MAQERQEDAVFPLTDTDKWVLSQTDDEFVPHDWESLKAIIDSDNLSVLRRKPSDLRRYMQWTAETKAAYGSTIEYLRVHRLPAAWGRPPYAPVSTRLFADPADYRVILNAWPYGLTPDITHLVVWTRTPIPCDPATGLMTPESRAAVAQFVQRYFADPLEAEPPESNHHHHHHHHRHHDNVSHDGGRVKQQRVLWFKNWPQLQSVRELEHIHILARDASPALVETWTAELVCHRAENRPADTTKGHGVEVENHQ